MPQGVEDRNYSIANIAGLLYAVTDAVRSRTASEFAPKLTTGKPQYDSRTQSSYLAMTSWTPGLGVFIADHREDQGRFWDSNGMDTRFANQMTLGPLVTTITSTASLGTALDNGGIATFYEYLAVVYCAIGDKVFRGLEVDGATGRDCRRVLGPEQAESVCTHIVADRSGASSRFVSRP